MDSFRSRTLFRKFLSYGLEPPCTQTCTVTGWPSWNDAKFVSTSRLADATFVWLKFAWAGITEGVGDTPKLTRSLPWRHYALWTYATEISKIIATLLLFLGQEWEERRLWINDLLSVGRDDHIGDGYFSRQKNNRTITEWPDANDGQPRFLEFNSALTDEARQVEGIRCT